MDADTPPPTPPIPTDPTDPTAPAGRDPIAQAGMRRLADLLDTRFRIPGTQQTFGFDAILGIVPGLGDAAGLVASAVLVTRAVGLGARGWTLVNMLLRMALDATIGSVPVAGTVFDVVYKANTRNVQLLQEHLADPAATRVQARRSVLRSLAAVLLVTVVLVVVLIAGTAWLWGRITG